MPIDDDSESYTPPVTGPVATMRGRDLDATHEARGQSRYQNARERLILAAPGMVDVLVELATNMGVEPSERIKAASKVLELSVPKPTEEHGPEESESSALSRIADALTRKPPA